MNEAAALADDYVLTHRPSFGGSWNYSRNFGEHAEVEVASNGIHLSKTDIKERNVRGFQKKHVITVTEKTFETGLFCT